MPDGQEYTTVQLKEGTTLQLKGANLTPDAIRAGVNKYRMSQGPSIGNGMPAAPQMSPYDMKYAAGGFTPSIMGGAVKDLAVGTGGFLKDLLLKPGMPVTGRGQPGSSLVERYVDQPAEQENKMGQELTQAGHPIAGAIQQGIAKTVPFIGPPIGQALESMREGNFGGPTAQAAALYAGGRAAKAVKGGVDVVTGQKPLSETLPGKTANEILGTGQSMANLKTWLHESATKKIQPYVAQVAKGVHDDAAQAMSSVAQKIDAAHPEGVFDKADIKGKVQDAMGEIVKVPEKVPTSVAKIINPEKVTRATGPTVGGRHFDLSNPTDLTAFNRMKSQGVFSPDEISRMEGEKAGAGWSFEQLKQLRSDVGRELAGLKGPTRAAGNRVYGVLSQELRGAAKENVAEPEWLNANAKWTNYMNDFVRGPLSKTLSGLNARDITDPFIGKTSEQVKNALAKYDPQTLPSLMQEINKHKIGSIQDRWNKPSKMDLLIAAVSPKAAAIRLAIPRTMRNPGIIESIAGKGLPEMPPKRVSSAPPTGNGASQ